MENLKTSMKYSLIFGLLGAVLIPVFYEVYANISRSVGLFFIACWAIFAGVKFSSLSAKEAFVGITCTIAYSGILGMICYIIIHPAVQKMLTENSVYFQLDLKSQMFFLLYAVLISILMYLIWLVRLGLTKAFHRLRNNRKMAGDYIANAFNDDNEDLK
ncbi:MAG: hypothetical protein ACI4I6_09950 [Hominimerdicola sp.]